MQNQTSLIYKLTIIIIYCVLFTPNCRKPSSSKRDFLDAVRFKEYDRVQDLIDLGEDVNQSDYRSGETALLLAIAKRDFDMVEILLKAKADPNKKSIFHGPIHLASDFCSPEILRILINAKADINAQNAFDYYTPLEISLLNGNLKCTEILINSGAKIEGLSVSHIFSEIAEKGRTEILNYILDVLDIQIYQHEANLALLRSVRSGNINTVQYLLKKNLKLNTNFFDDDGDALIHIATKYNRTSILNLLLTAGADPNLKNKKGETPIRIALKQKNLSLAEILKNSGATN
ncbi:ankyrin repeat domain-containing protein [Leptospira noumeaensis]|uniref:Ankyrin repeat domain-containing protein n=1 Tax=Leptospira noumeaensis TaxID=2484964 RepID=A0A4R9I939_9LEPT|nr:ankyrin repeat domain-containing protein [Leptospira noumeaensis]TGK82985.1 ankyrin repeat domain-containing protein [Leptospira noumeaensis]